MAAACQPTCTAGISAALARTCPKQCASHLSARKAQRRAGASGAGSARSQAGWRPPPRRRTGAADPPRAAARRAHPGPSLGSACPPAPQLRRRRRRRRARCTGGGGGLRVPRQLAASAGAGACRPGGRRKVQPRMLTIRQHIRSPVRDNMPRVPQLDTHPPRLKWARWSAAKPPLLQPRPCMRAALSMTHPATQTQACASSQVRQRPWRVGAHISV